MIPCQIKPLTIKYLDQVLQLEKKLFPTPWRYDSFLSELNCVDSDGYIVLSSQTGAEEQVIAYICYRILLDEMHLMKIGVAPHRQHAGVATFLFQSSMKIALANGAVTVYLEVRTSNLPAISLYHKLGFEIIGKRPRYYPETGEDALVLMKKL